MKNKKLSLLGCVILVLVAFSVNPRVCSGRELSFGPVISSVEGTGIKTLKSSADSVHFSGGKAEILRFNLDTSKTSLKTVSGHDYVDVEGLKPCGNPGDPQLPFRSFVVTLPLNSEVLGVSANNVSYRHILNKLDIVPNAAPVTSGHSQKQAGLDSANAKKTYKRSKTLDSSSQSFFPGNMVSYYTGKDGKNRYVFVYFFPMHYIQATGQAILITNADITVNYQLGD
jgi:hypothetical protein